MWCSLEERSPLSVSVIVSINEYLGLSRNTPDPVDWPDNWSSDAENDADLTLNFSECLVSCSPSLDCMVFGRRQRVILVSFDAESGEGRISGKIECGENVTTLLTLPVGEGTSKGKPSQWTVILVGTDRGNVRFYSADRRGAFLFDARFVPESAVISVDVHFCSTGQNLSILHSNGVLVSIDGLSLYAHLKAALSSGAHQGRASTIAQDLNESKRYALGKDAFRATSKSDRQGAFHKGTLVQVDRLTQMISASMIGGPGASLSEEPPYGILHSTVRDSPQLPCMSFYWLPEHKPELSFGALVGSVSSKVKSMVSSASFLGSFVSSQSKESGQPAKPTSLATRFVIHDAHRSGLGAYPVYGMYKLQALVDSRARVCLIDSEDGQILRVWKGFRDGQCAFFTAVGSIPDESGAKRVARSTFAVLYAPRNGVLEIYPALAGPRYGAFNVGHTGKLVQLSSPVLGQDRPFLGGVVFIDACGTIKNVVVPFSIALQDESGQSLRDAALVKELRKVLINFDTMPDSAAAVGRLLDDLKTYDWLNNSVRIIKKQSSLSPGDMDKLLGLCIDVCAKLAQPDKLSDRPAQDFEMLACVVEGYRNLVNLFVSIEAVKRESASAASHGQQEVELHRELGLEEEKLSSYITNLNECLIARAQICPFTEATSEEVLLTEFLAAFIFEKGRNGAIMKLNEDLKDLEAVRLGTFIFSGIFTSPNFSESYAKIVLSLHLSREATLSLLIRSWLYKPHTYSALPSNVFGFLIRFVPPSATDITTLDSLALTGILASRYLPEAFAFTIVVRGAVVSLDSKRKRLSEEDEDFEVVDSRQEKWDNLLCTCHSLLPILTMSYHLSAANSAVEADKLVSIPRLIECRQDSVIPLVSHAISHGSSLIGPGKLTELFGRIEHVSPDENLSSWECCFVKIAQSFPLSLTPDRLFAQLAIEYGIRWSEEPDRIDLIKCSIAHAKAIANPIVQHGIANFLWMSQLSPRFQKLTNLMEKIGKFPKDRLARKEVGVGEERIVDYADACIDVINVLFDANAQYEASSLSLIDGLEEQLSIFFQKFCPVDSSAQMPLSRLAFTTRCTNYHLVKLYWQLAIVVKLMLQGRLKPARPFDLFDAKGKAALSKSLHSYPLLPRNDPKELDTKTQVTRSHLFRSYVTSMLSNHLPYPPRFDGSISLPDMTLACTLLQEWEMSSDTLWVHCVLELYSMGYDGLAEQIMCRVRNKASLGAELLMLVGQRLAVKLNDPLDKFGSSPAVSLLSPTLKTWLKTQDVERVEYKESTIGATKNVLRYARTYLPENNAESVLAKQLAEFLEKFV